MSAGSGQQINAGNSGRALDSADKPRKVGVCRPRKVGVCRPRKVGVCMPRKVGVCMPRELSSVSYSS